LIPNLNLLSVPVSGNGGTPAVPATAPEAAVAPVSPDSFAAILTTTAVVAGLGGEGALPFAAGGNLQQPGGKDLPLLPGADNGQALLTESGQDSLLAALPVAGADPLSIAAGPDTLIAAQAGELAAGELPSQELNAAVPLQADAAEGPVVVGETQLALESTPGAVAAVAKAAEVVQAGASLPGATPPVEPDTRPLPGAAQEFNPADLRRTPQATPGADADTMVPRQETGLNPDQLAARPAVTAAVPEVVDGAEAMQARSAGNPSPTAIATLGPAPLATEAASGAAPRPEVMNNPPGHPNWGGEFVGRVSLMLKNGVNEARLQLNPPELGQLDIRITTEGDRAVILFNVQHSAAREAIDLAMPRLREMLEQSGLQLAHSEVADHSQSGRGGSERPGEWQAAEPGSAADSEDQSDPLEGPHYALDLSDTGTVDYYA